MPDVFVPVTLAVKKEQNRGRLHQTKSSYISLRCTCLALPATRWLDNPRSRARRTLTHIGWKPRILIGILLLLTQTQCLSVLRPVATLTHGLQTLRCVPLRSAVGCASEKNIGCAYRKLSSRALRLLPPQVVVSPLCSFLAWPLAGAATWQCCLRLQHCCRCCPLRSCADGGASVGGAGWRLYMLHQQELHLVRDLFVSQNTLEINLRTRMHFACEMLSTTILQIALTCEREMPTAARTAGA
jgi:hypothetical protein